MIKAVNRNASQDDISNLLTDAKLATEDKLVEIPFSDLVNLLVISPENLEKHPLLEKIITPNVIDFMFTITASTKTGTVGHTIAEGEFMYQKPKLYMTGKESTSIWVHNRSTGKLEEEKIPEFIWISMRMMYQAKSGRFAVSNKQVHKLLKYLSTSYGKKYNSPASKKHIYEFANFFKLDLTELREPIDSFPNFNEFFYRKLLPTARPVACLDNPKVLVSPADCRLNVFATIEDATKVWIKGKNFSLPHLLQDDNLAKEFSGGSLLISRLAPQDYHRFHSPVDGIIESIQNIDGTYYTVNPVAICEDIDVYTENKRSKLLIKSPQFGDVIYITVGATLVGSINFTVHEGEKIRRGDEIGYFAFGGSTLLVMFKPGVMEFDLDLLVNSSKPIETLVRMGSQCGHSKI